VLALQPEDAANTGWLPDVTRESEKQPFFSHQPTQIAFAMFMIQQRKFWRH
jgi:hypothetical protein